MKTLVKRLVLILCAVVVMYVGGMGRYYPAFGGEDIVGLLLIGLAVMPTKEELNS